MYAGEATKSSGSGEELVDFRSRGWCLVRREGDTMPPTPLWSFAPFRLDSATASLWRGEQLIPLPPKPLAVLAYLVAHAGQVVTKDALLAAVWPEVVVTEGV